MRRTQEFPGHVRAFAMLALAAALFAASTAAFPHEPDAEEIALGSLVDAELAFAKSSATQGVREAFLANFAPDGIALQPSPTRIATAWREAEPGRAPNATQLDWKPAQGGSLRATISASRRGRTCFGPRAMRRTHGRASTSRCGSATRQADGRY